MSETIKKPRQRILALDILRGITIAGMILVNYPGSWGHIYAPLEHASWNGLTPTDLVFPFFMFIMGVSTFISLRKYDFSFSWPAVIKILRRTVVIFAIGLAVVWFGMILRVLHSEDPFCKVAFNFSHIRILGVLPRLALCYGFAAIIALSIKHKYIPAAIVLLLVVYAVLLFIGHGWDFSSDNIISKIDHCVLGENHMYGGDRTPDGAKFDPEGVLSTLPAIAHVLIGFCCGKLIMGTKENTLRINKLFIVGTALTFAGFLLDYGMPINKKIWSPTFVLTTCGLAASFLGLLIWIIDIKGYKKWCRFFESFGINPLFMYVLGSVLSIGMGNIRVAYAASESGVTSLNGWVYRACLVPFCGGNETLASLCFAILFVLLNWCIGYVLYKKKIYIKI